MAGYITTASDYKKALLENERDIFGNATWKNAYSNIDYQRQIAEGQLSRQFGQDIGTAYQAAMQQRRGILGSNLGTGYKEAALEDIDLALDQAYNTYMGSLSQSQAELAGQTQAAYQNIDEMLQQRAENMAELDLEHYNYAVAVDKWYQEHGTALAEGETESAYDRFMNDRLWSKLYTTDPVTGMKRLMTYEELATPRIDPVTGEYISLYDAEGNLTPRGTDYYDLLENYYAQRVAAPGEELPPSFAAYLYETNPELYNWANEDNPFSYTPTGLGKSQNIGAFKELVGMESADEQYSFLERYGGLSSTEINNIFSDLYTELDKENLTIDDISAGVDKFAKLADDLGYKSVDWDQVKTTANTLYNEYKDLESAYSAEKDAAGTSTALSIGAGALAVVAALATVIAYANPAGPVTGPTLGTASAGGVTSLAGASVGFGSAAKNSREQAKVLMEAMQNKELDMQDVYRTTLTSMVNEIQRGYTAQQIANGGRFGSMAVEQTSLGKGAALDQWSTQSDIPMSDKEYNTYLTQIDKRSSNKLNYRTSGYTIGSDNTIKITIKTGGERYDVGLGEVVNTRAEQFLNRYATGNIDTSPERRTMVKVNNELYMYVKDGWRKVIPLAHDVSTGLHGSTTYTTKDAEDYKRAYQDLLSAF